jgi:hypothetical protein
MSHPSARWALLLAAITAASLAPSRAHAVRPFITDDARVVGDGYLQVETWALVEQHGIEHWVTSSMGFGPMEIAAGFVWGGLFEGEEAGVSLQGPLVQMKLLMRPTMTDQLFGIAVACGALDPHSVGAFQAEHWSGYVYLAATQSFYGDDLLIHANVGLAVIGGEEPLQAPLVGVGAQARVLGPLALVAEVVLGDALDAESDGGTAQGGVRLLLSDEVQVDSTVGVGLWGDAPEWWATAGIRWVAPRMWMNASSPVRPPAGLSR